MQTSTTSWLCRFPDGSKSNNSNVALQTLCNDNSVTGFADQSKNVQATVTPTVTPTSTPTPIPEPCGTGTIFNATLQADIDATLPSPTVSCLNQAPGNNMGIVAILTGATTVTVNMVVAQVGLGNTCTSPFVLAAVSSGAITTGSLSGATFVCVKKV